MSYEFGTIVLYRIVRFSEFANLHTLNVTSHLDVTRYYKVTLRARTQMKSNLRSEPIKLVCAQSRTVEAKKNVCTCVSVWHACVEGVASGHFL